MTGGVSHVDSFDPKPALAKAAADGKKGPQDVPFMGSPWGSKRFGKSGVEVSDLFPHIGGIVDDLCLIRSMTGDHNDHFQATLGIHTGSVTVKRPSIGSWVSYGMGTENQNLPSFVVLAPYLPYAGAQVWSSDFLPGAHPGTRITRRRRAGRRPAPACTHGRKHRSWSWICLPRFNKLHQQSRPATRRSRRASSHSRRRSGCRATCRKCSTSRKNPTRRCSLRAAARQNTGFAWQCLVARRLAERGVRFIELIDTGSNKNWDFHTNMAGMTKLAENVDLPIAGLIRDLKSARHARRHARGLDDGIRPHPMGHAGEQRPRALQQGLLVPGSPGAESSRASCTALPMNSASASRKTKCTCTTSMRRFCIASASIIRG